MRPPPAQTIHEFAESHRIVSRPSARHGRWHSEPFQKPVLEAITSSENPEGVLYVGPSQVAGKTEVLLNAIAYFIAADPSSQIVVTYSLEMAQRLSKHRLASMLRDTPILRGCVREARSRDSGNTILDKLYDGGDLTLVGANSEGGLSSSPKRVGLFDELDRWPASAGTGGDPLSLALQRLESYWNAVKLYVTSPGVREISRSWRLWQQSDQREWHVDCPDCRAPQVPKWTQVQWDKGPDGEHRPETAAYVCERCGSTWSEIDRWRACDRGGYVATAKHTGLAGFRTSALAISGIDLERLVRRWLGAQGNPEEIKAFRTLVLTEWWDERYTTVDHTGLLGRREMLASRDGRTLIPKAAPIVTAGVDVQDNRFEISVYAWGEAEESWLLDHAVIFCDPSAAESWANLGRWLDRPWPRAAGGLDFIRAECVDTGGHHTQAAYDFCAARYQRRTPDGGGAFTFATKGTHGRGEIWPAKPSKTVTKVRLWTIRVDTAKEMIYGRLARREPGPGYLHFGESVEEPFFEGLTSQKCTTRRSRRGELELFWQTKRAGLRDEPLDCAVLALAALRGLRAHGYFLEAELEALGKRTVFEAGPDEPALSQRELLRRATQAPSEVDELRGEAERTWLGDTRGWLKR